MKKGQSKKHSLAETTTNIIVGYVIAILAQLILFPFYGIRITISENVTISLWFTAISLIRSYALRRIFNKIMIKGWD